MTFRLVLRGALPPEKRGTANAKHRIRRELHPQLRTLWEQHPLFESLGGSPSRIDQIAEEYTRCGFRFVPLVTAANQMACSLDIVILRRDVAHRVMSGTGDLDNRIKTLIDGLKMPQQCSELGGSTPSEGEDPFFCLLEDDRLIYDFRVQSDRLLLPPETSESERDIFALIEVHVMTWAGNEVNVFSSV